MKLFRRLFVAVAFMACLIVTLPGRNENHVLAASGNAGCRTDGK